jgi:hypothetical protein
MNSALAEARWLAVGGDRTGDRPTEAVPVDGAAAGAALASGAAVAPAAVGTVSASADGMTVGPSFEPAGVGATWSTTGAAPEPCGSGGDPISR